MSAVEQPDPATTFSEDAMWFFWSEYVEREALRTTNPHRRSYLFALADEHRRKAARVGEAS